MRKALYNIFLIIIFFICSMLFASCKAITAQNIPYNDSNPRMNGSPMMNGDGRPDRNLLGEMEYTHIMGKITSVDGNLVKIELAEQVQDNEPQNSNDERHGEKGNQNNNNSTRPAQKRPSGSMFEIKYTGSEKALIVNDDVNISQQYINPQNKTDNSKSAIKVSDLKAGQIIMIWYKENSETVDRISIVQS